MSVNYDTQIILYYGVGVVKSLVVFDIYYDFTIVDKSYYYVDKRKRVQLFYKFLSCSSPNKNIVKIQSELKLNRFRRV